MAIIFSQQKKSQKNLIIVFSVVIVITIVVVLQGFLNKKNEESSLGKNIALPQEEIKIDFNVLKNPVLKEFQSFSDIEPLKLSTSTVKGKIQTTGQKGRENPFSPR